MVRSPGPYRCRNCSARSAQMLGRCASCGEWGSLRADGPARSAVESRSPLARAADLSSVGPPVTPTGVSELDRVLGGGLVPGSVTLLGGEPGVGKSTLAVQALAGLAGEGHRCLLVSAEESLHQVGLRIRRLVASPMPTDDLWLAATTSVAEIESRVAELEPSHLVVDSIQTIADATVGTQPGSLSQVRECAHRLTGLAKRASLTTILVGHVTKEGSLAGPRTLEHLVDTVLDFTGDGHHSLRLLRATKHRFGPTGELGLFEMDSGGLVAVADAGELLLADRRPGAPGSVTVPTLEGRRPLVVEVQALVGPAGATTPSRRAQGLDGGRLGMVLAVLERRLGLKLATAEVYALAIGGVRVREPCADLAMALAVASSLTGRPVDDDLVVCGEVGLGGEIRRVPDLDRRLSEAARLGFRRALVPESAPDVTAGLTLLRAGDLGRALHLAGLVPALVAAG